MESRETSLFVMLVLMYLVYDFEAIIWRLCSKALNRIFLSFDNIDNKVKNLVKIDLSDKIR